MWTKPKFWGGYDTSTGVFYLEKTTGGKVGISERACDWEVEYENWLNQTGQIKWDLFGFRSEK
jgi:hypothetical protein